MASFQAKIGWKRQRKRKNKNYRSVTFPQDRLLKIPKKQQKYKKKIPLLHRSEERRVGKEF